MSSTLTPDEATKPRKGMPSPQLAKDEFKRRYGDQFVDPAFRTVQAELDKITDIAWDAYDKSRKAPVTRKAGAGFSNAAYELSVDWIAAQAAVEAAQLRHDDDTLSARILLINGSSRSEHSCPGEMSKSFRLVEIAQDVIEKEFSVKVDILDLSRLASAIWPQHPPVQGMFFHCRTAVSLALLVLSKSRHGPDPRLDERHLPAVGCSPRRDDRDAGQLVSGHLAGQADDGPSGLRRRRQPRSDPDRWKRRKPGQKDRAGRLGLSAPSGGPRVFRGGAWRCCRCRERAAVAVGLTEIHEAGPRRAERRG